MNRDEKNAKVQELNKSFAEACFAVVTDYRGLKVSELEELRTKLRATNTQYRIAKNTLLKIAVQGTAYENLSDSFQGTTGVVLAFEDPVSPAKALSEFAKDHDKLVVRSAGLDGQLLGSEEVIQLSKLPGKDELRAKLLGTLNAVPTGLVRVLNGVPSKFVYLLQAIKDNKEN